MNLHENDEINKIKQAIETFLDGIFSNDYKKIYSVFHKEAQSIGYSPKKEDIVIVRRDHWKEMFDDYNPEPELEETAKIEFIDTIGRAAIARVRIDQEALGNSRTFYDYYSLQKINEDWKIVNKNFHQESNNEVHRFNEWIL